MDPRIADTNAIYHGLPSRVLMENAGRGIADRIQKRYAPKKVCIVCGTGNNGGDGFVVARHLESFCDVDVVMPWGKDRVRTPESRENHALLSHCDVRVIVSYNPVALEGYDLIVDAMLGIGAQGAVREPYASYIRAINSSAIPVVAIDLPSGLGSGLEVEAGEVMSPHVQKVEGAAVMPIGIPGPMTTLCGPGNVRHLHKRPQSAHKRNGGTVAVVGGSETYHGAPAYASVAASYIADLVYTICPAEVGRALRCLGPDLIVKELGTRQIAQDIHPIFPEVGADAAVIGMGAGRGRDTAEALLNTYEHASIPLVIDADGLFALCGHADILGKNMCLTPHAKEYEMLFGTLPETVDARMGAVEKTSREHGCTILLKGKTDIVSNGVETWKNTTGNEGMTTGGTGDVLAGCVGGFAAKNPLLESACAAAFAVGLAGDCAYAADATFFTASRVAAELPGALSFCMRC